MGWSVTRISSSLYHGLVYVPCLILMVPWVGLCPLSHPRCTMCLCSVSRISSSLYHGLACVPCLILVVPWFGLCPVYHPRCTMVGLCPVSHPQCTMGCSVARVLFSLYHGLVCGPCLILTVQWVGLWPVSHPHYTMGWSVTIVSS